MRAYQSVRHCDDCGYQLRETQHGWFEELPYKVHLNIDHDHVMHPPGSTINLSRSQAARMDQGQIKEIPWSCATNAKAASGSAADHQIGNITGNLAYPGRASWLKEQLRLRSWNKHDVERQRGPNHKTVQRILDGFDVRVDVLEKLATALSEKGGKIEPMDIPEN